MSTQTLEETLKSKIRDLYDWPQKGIIFRDITTLLKDPEGLHQAIDGLYQLVKDKQFDKIVAVESRGFIFGVPLAYKMNRGFVPVRKPKKLPCETVSQTYDLEYGTDTIQMHKDAINPGEKVLIVDDLIATGGSAQATAKLVEQLGGEVIAFAFLIELTFLNGREKLTGYPVESIIKY